MLPFDSTLKSTSADASLNTTELEAAVVIVRLPVDEVPQNLRLLSSNMVLSGETTKKITHGNVSEIQF